MNFRSNIQIFKTSIILINQNILYSECFKFALQTVLIFFLHSDPVHSSAEVSDSRHSLRRRQDDNDQGTNYLTRIPLSQFFRLTANSAQTGVFSQIFVKDLQKKNRGISGKNCKGKRKAKLGR